MLKTLDKTTRNAVEAHKTNQFSVFRNGINCGIYCWPKATHNYHLKFSGLTSLTHSLTHKNNLARKHKQQGQMNVILVSQLGELFGLHT